MNRTPVTRKLGRFWILCCLGLAALSMGAKDCFGSSTDEGGGAGSGSSTTAGAGAGDGAGTGAGEGAGTGGVVCTAKACVGETCGGFAGLPCPDDWYCNYPVEALCGAADQTGECAPKPEACTDLVSPVCGCDDKTYSSGCEAALAGVSVVSEGACGAGGVECSDSSPCPQPGCACLDENVDGQCENTCPSFKCVAGKCVDASAPPTSACGSRGSVMCAEDEYCAYPPEAMCGATDIPGVCTPLGGPICTLDYVPVCGCNGMTYGNACAAAAAGVSVASTGECK